MQRPPPRSTRTYTPVPYATLFRSLGRKPVLAQSPLRADRVAKTLAIARCEPMRHQIELREALREHQRMVISVVVGAGRPAGELRALLRSEEHTSELQSLMRISYAVFCLKKKTTQNSNQRQQK